MSTESKNFVKKPGWVFAFVALFVLVLLFCATVTLARPRDHDLPAAGLVRELAASYNDALQVLQEIVHDQTIRGTYMSNREQTLTAAIAADSTPLFKPWDGAGKVFYKVRAEAIAPGHFRESADMGTVAVRYVLTSISPERTRLRIDAIFVEKARRVTHASDGTVESSEYKAIEERLQAIQSAQQQAAEAQSRRESIALAQQTLLRQREDETSRLAIAQTSARDLEHRVDALRHEVERRVKAPGAPLKAAPFSSAANIAELPAYTEVVIVIVTPHWLGVETPQSQRGWLPIDQLERLP